MVVYTWLNFDDDSDLTDLEEDELEDEEENEPTPPPPPPPIREATTPYTRKATRPGTQQATQKSKARSSNEGFPWPALTPGRNTTFSTASIRAMLKRGTLDLNPEYQRGIVWNDAKQSALINSLYNNVHVPQVIFYQIKLPDGSTAYRCMDGKQRLTSINRFMDGEIPVKPHMDSSLPARVLNQKFWASKDEKTKLRKLVPENRLHDFEEIQISCFIYSGNDITPEFERDLFQRVQNGVALTPADRLPATNGPWADLTRELRQRINTTEGFEGYLNWGAARGKDFQALGQFVYLTQHGSNTRGRNKAEPNPTRLETFLSSTDSTPSTAAKANIFSTMDIFCWIASTPELGKPLTVFLSPLEFVMSAYLIYQQQQILTDRQLSGALQKMRDNAKKNCSSDMKFNTVNFKHLLAFVNQLAKKGGVGRAEAGEKVAASVPYVRVVSDVDRFKYKTGAEDETHASKRKRAILDDEMDDGASDGEYVAAPPSAKKTKKTPAEVASLPKTPVTKVGATLASGSGSKAKTTLKKTPPKVTTSKAAAASSSKSAHAPTSSTAGPSNTTKKPSMSPSTLGKRKLESQTGTKTQRPAARSRSDAAAVWDTASDRSGSVPASASGPSKPNSSASVSFTTLTSQSQRAPLPTRTVRTSSQDKASMGSVMPTPPTSSGMDSTQGISPTESLSANTGLNFNTSSNPPSSTTSPAMGFSQPSFLGGSKKYSGFKFSKRSSQPDISLLPGSPGMSGGMPVQSQSQPSPVEQIHEAKWQETISIRNFLPSYFSSAATPTGTAAPATGSSPSKAQRQSQPPNASTTIRRQSQTSTQSRTQSQTPTQNQEVSLMTPTHTPSPPAQHRQTPAGARMMLNGISSAGSSAAGGRTVTQDPRLRAASGTPAASQVQGQQRGYEAAAAMAEEIRQQVTRAQQD